MLHRKWLNIGLLFAVFYCFLLQPVKVEAKKSKKGKNKDKVSILKKGWGDVNTRNNYYFNAKMIYDELLRQHERSTELNFDQLLPFYLHDREPGLSSHKSELQKIIIKTGIVLQRHDYSRWKDDSYTLLGKAYFLRGDIDSALVNFQYVSTALRGNFNDTKVAVSQKEILKAKVEKQKELNRLAKDRKKEMETQAKAKKAETEKAAEDKTKRMAAAKKAKEKELKKKIKAKNKMIKQKAKGKYKAPAPSVNKSSPAKTKSEKDSKEKGNFLDKVSEGISLDFDVSGDKSKLKKAEQKVRALENKKERLEAANVEDSLTQKQIENRHKLTLWEKIKHLRSRPEALVWMTKSFIKLGEMQKAESIVEYSKTLVKLRKNQLKDVHIVRSYYYYNIGNKAESARALEEAIPFIKNKKEKHYYNFLLAQLVSEKEPEKAFDIFQEIHTKSKDEVISFNALEKMYRFAEEDRVGSAQTEEILKAYKKLVKSKIVGDQALYRLADISLKDSDTASAVEYLKKSLTYPFSKPEQKGHALAKLGEIAYEQYVFKDAKMYYDSALTMITADTVWKKKLTADAKVLESIVTEQNLAYQQDSLLYLSTLTKSELAQYIKEQHKIERKQKRREAIKGTGDGSFTSEGLGNNSNFNTNQSQYTTKGKWYFYNIDLKTRGFNEFKQIWGSREQIKDWRRGEVVHQNLMGVADLLRENADRTVEETIDLQLKIPETEEEFEKAYDVIARSYLSRAKDFFNGLDDSEVALLYLDSLIKRFPGHEIIPEAYYTQMLIFSEIGRMKQAEFAADFLINNFPEHELAQKIIDSREIKYVKKDEVQTGKAERYYVSLYGLYEDEKYADVIIGKKDFISRFSSETSLLPKVNFLEALSLARTGETTEYRERLIDIVNKYPETTEAKKARLFLQVLEEHNKQSSKEEDIRTGTQTAEQIYKYSDGAHYIAFLLKDKNYNSAEIISTINDIMSKSFPKGNIKASNSFLDAQTPMLLVKTFKNKSEAAAGLNELVKSDNLLIKFLLAGGEILLISQDNFRTLFTSKKIEEYKVFYQENYK